MTPADRQRKRELDGPDCYFGHPLLTRTAEERATEDAYRRINDDGRYRFEPWTAALP